MTSTAEGAMEHPIESQLERYLDGELDDVAQEHISSHLQVCSECRALVSQQARLSEMVRATVPEPEAFATEGEFWVGLAARLSARPASRWSLLSLLPPFLLAALGSLFQVMLTAVIGAFGLSALGVLPSPVTPVTEGLSSLLSQPWLAGVIYSRLGWTSAEVVRAASTHWQAIGTAAQHGILLTAIAAMLFVVLAVIGALYLVWVLCWPGMARPEVGGGN